MKGAGLEQKCLDAVSGLQILWVKVIFKCFSDYQEVINFSLVDKFEGFDCKVLELKTVFNMKGTFGRKRRVSSTVVTGNQNGLAGFAMGKGIEPRTAMRKAKNRSAQKLMHIKLFRNHTVFHDFFTQYGATKIYVSQKPPGYGLVCHRAIRTICQVIGIKDIYAKVEGSTNVNHIIKAFFLGLVRQVGFVLKCFFLLKLQFIENS